MADVIAELVGRLGYEVDDSGLDKFNDGTDKAGKSAEGLASKVAKGTAAIAGMALAAVSAAAKITESLVSSFADGAVEVDTWAKKIDSTTQELQRLEFAAKRSGAEVDNMREAAKTLRENLGEMARVGTGPAVDSLGSLGIKLNEIKDLPLEQQFGLLSTAFNELEDNSKRLSIAIELMGEDGGALLPLFQKGADGIAALGAEAEATGQVLSEDQVEAARKAQHAFAELDGIGQRLTNTLGSSLAPVIPKVVEGVEAWLAENEEFIEQDLPAFLEAAVEVVGDVIKFFADAAASVDDFIAEVEHLIDDINDEFGPAIEWVIELGSTLIGIWGKVSNGIAYAVLKLLSFVGAVDDLREAWLKFQLATGQTPDDPNFRGGAARGAPGFKGGEENPNNKRLAADKAFREGLKGKSSADLAAIRATDLPGHRIAEVDQAIAGALAREAKEYQQRVAATEAESQAKLKQVAGAAAAAERAKRRKKFEDAAKAKAAGAGGKKKTDTKAAEALFGDRLRDLGGFAGASDKATDAAIEAAAKALEAGASNEVAFGAGLGQLESLTGATLQTGSIADAIESAIFGTGKGGPGGGGATPTAGAKFVRIDASYNAPTTVEIKIDGAEAGLSAGDIAQVVEDRIGDVLDERNRRAFDHFKRNVQV